MNLKKSLTILLLVAMVVLAACQAQPAPAPAPAAPAPAEPAAPTEAVPAPAEPAPAEKVNVGFVPPALTSPFHVAMVDGAKAEADKFGWSMDVDVYKRQPFGGDVPDQ